MDLGVAGRRAIVCASTQGLGLACARALAAEGVHVVINGRNADRLVAAAADLAGYGVEVTTVVADLTTQDGREALIEACPAPDILVTNNSGPKPGRLADLADRDLQRAFDLHYWPPISLARAVLPGMQERGFGRIVNITSAMVTAPRPHQVASVGARTGMVAVMKALSRDAAAYGVTINQLLAERIDTPRQEEMARYAMAQEGITYEEARRRQAESIAAKRHGRPDELGAACAFLCSAHAGFISGAMLHIDGGSYPGLV